LTADGDKLYYYGVLGRLTKVSSGPNSDVDLAEYRYDDVGRLAMQITYDYRQDGADPYDQLNTTRYFYYDNQRVVEQRNGDEDVTDQFVWGPAYVDELLTHDRDSDGNGTLDQRLYGVHDRLYSVLAVVDEDGDPVEEYQYSPYGANPLDPRTGVAAITDADTGLPLSAELAAGQRLYTGRPYDKVIGMNHHGARRLSHNLGRWNRQDPLGVSVQLDHTPKQAGAAALSDIEPQRQYQDGADLYVYARANPCARLDAAGLVSKERCLIYWLQRGRADATGEILKAALECLKELGRPRGPKVFVKYVECVTKKTGANVAGMLANAVCCVAGYPSEGSTQDRLDPCKGNPRQGTYCQMCCDRKHCVQALAGQGWKAATRAREACYCNCEY